MLKRFIEALTKRKGKEDTPESVETIVEETNETGVGVKENTSFGSEDLAKVKQRKSLLLIPEDPATQIEKMKELFPEMNIEDADLKLLNREEVFVIPKWWVLGNSYAEIAEKFVRRHYDFKEYFFREEILRRHEQTVQKMRELNKNMDFFVAKVVLHNIADSVDDFRKSLGYNEFALGIFEILWIDYLIIGSIGDVFLSNESNLVENAKSDKIIICAGDDYWYRDDDDCEDKSFAAPYFDAISSPHRSLLWPFMSQLGLINNNIEKKENCFLVAVVQ